MSGARLQALLVQETLVSTELIDWAVEVSRDNECTWLEQLVLLGALDEEKLCRCVAHAAWVPCCASPQLAEIPGHVLACLPPEVAAEHRAVPIGLEPEGDLRVAMLDPTDVAAVKEIEFFAGRRILREAATAVAIAWALFHHYGVSSPLWPPAEQAQAADA